MFKLAVRLLLIEKKERENRIPALRTSQTTDGRVKVVESVSGSEQLMVAELETLTCIAEDKSKTKKR